MSRHLRLKLKRKYHQRAALEGACGGGNGAVRGKQFVTGRLVSCLMLNRRLVHRRNNLYYFTKGLSYELFKIVFCRIFVISSEKFDYLKI